MKYQSIVFSGLPGAGKSTLVAKLKEIYKWPMLSVGDLWRARWANLCPDKEISFEEYWRTTSSEDNRQVNVDFREQATKNHLIGDCRYTVYLKDLPVFLVFLTADLNIRAKRGVGLAKYNGNGEKEIKEILYRREADEVAASKRLFGYDYRDPANYHLVLNTAMLSQEEEIAVIKSLLK
ncbi:MAG: cytidylate kinase family protein [Minisyncoccales bacterium]|nr:cytidylate kinase family protein [Candidatus Pacearchaeota archaeon]